MKMLQFVIVLVLVLASTSVVNAQTPSVSDIRPTKAERIEKMQQAREEKKEERAASAVDRLKKKANTELERRIKALTHLITVINKFKKISDSEKASLTAQVQAQIDALTALKAKITAATDLETLRADVASIKKDYRIFALFIPKIHIMANVERLLTSVEKAEELANNLETRITAATGQDTTTLKSLLASMRSHLEEAKRQANNAKNTVSVLTPEGYPANKTELMKARTLLKSAHEHLVLARKDARKIMQALKKNKPSGSPAVSATVVPLEE